MALTNSQYDSIMRIYSDRQLRARDLQQAHIDEAYARLPRLAEIDAEVASVSVQKALHDLGDADASDIDADRIIQELGEERRVLLQTAGYPADYLEPHYECPICHDTGYVDNRKCACFRQLEINTLYSSSNLTDVLEADTFANFRLDYYSDTERNPRTNLTPLDEAQKALQCGQTFCAQFSAQMQKGAAENLCIYGDVGTGKTFLTHCIAGELLSQGHSVLYLTAYDLFDLLGQYKFHSELSVRESRDSIFDCECLIIDDLGTEMNNNFVTSELFLIINERVLRNRSTIISTNLSLAHFRDAFSERTFSRIMGSYKLIHMSGKDIRIQKKISGGN